MLRISGIFCDYNVPKVQFWYSIEEKKVQSRTVLLTVLFRGVGIKRRCGMNEAKFNLLFSLFFMIMAGLLLLVQVHAPGILDDLSAIFQVKPLDDLTHVVFDGAL